MTQEEIIEIIRRELRLWQAQWDNAIEEAARNIRIKSCVDIGIVADVIKYRAKLDVLTNLLDLIDT